MKKKKKTAGELSVKASSDSTIYNSLEVGYALTEDIAKNLEECIEKHNKIIDEDEYCLVMLIVKDPLIKNVMRRKFYAWPYLPSPRPNQTVFLYNKRLHKIMKRLWVLPNVLAMETLYETSNVDFPFLQMQAWSRAFYDGRFFEFIRSQHNIDMLSESEYLNAHREELIKAGCKEIERIPSQPFDFSKVMTNKVINPDDSLLNQN